MVTQIVDTFRPLLAARVESLLLTRNQRFVRWAICSLCLYLPCVTVGDEQVLTENRSPFRILPTGQFPADQRRTQSRTIISGHPFTPPTNLDEWNKRREEIRTRVLVANGLWPMPDRPRVLAVIHGKMERNGYSIEKVYFESIPGHYVCGNLYRPTHANGKRPAILFPHGHFGNGRLYEANPDEVKKQIASGGERFEPNAKYPTQALLATMASHGYVVFQHDMVGRGDSRAIAHASGFDDADAILRLQSAMGLQTWNSIRALDFLCELDDVDVTRVGVTGPSGGGTQTILLCAIDDRPACSFPAVMVSESMQGGCGCENAPLLRIGGGNVEIAALFAPKPLGMTNANDWTLHFEQKSFPELQLLFRMYAKPDNVMVRRFPQFKHNFNQVSREVMYSWMNLHLSTEKSTFTEEEFEPTPPSQLSVFDESHRVAWSSIEKLRATQTEIAKKQWDDLEPKNLEDARRLQSILRGALQAMTATQFPSTDVMEVESRGILREEEYSFERLILSRRVDRELFARESIPAGVFLPKNWNGERMIVWVDSQGHDGLLNESKSAPRAEVVSLLRKGMAILSPDVLLTGEFVSLGGKLTYPKVSMENPRFTLTYNRSIIAHRVHDVLTAIGCAKHHYRAKSIDLIGFGDAGPWVLLARALAADHVRRTAADMNQFTFAAIDDPSDPSLLPGGLKYGDLIGLIRLIAPHELLLHNTENIPTKSVKSLKSAYAHFQADAKLRLNEQALPAKEVIEWMMQPEP